jgi:hypothetical protein
MAALAALRAAPVARPWRARAANNQATESAEMKTRVDSIKHAEPRSSNAKIVA